MIELKMLRNYSQSPESDLPENHGFAVIQGRYCQVYHFATEDLRPENIDMTVTFLANTEAMANVKTCTRLYNTIKKIIKCKVRFPDSWSCSRCKIKQELRLILNEIASQGITALIQNSSVKINSFPWLWCKADIYGSHPSIWDILLKPFPDEVARTFY